ncbi:MAG: flagellar hook-basal body complex protein FliE [Bryobacterales bacterium]|nr:flagellar hook-basal body complex protein FliE [Bryobacterales bacterium]
MIPSIPSAAPGLAGLEALANLYKSPLGAGSAKRPGDAAEASFATELAGAMAKVENSARASGELREKLLRGENVELHTVAIQAQEAQISFELLLQVRNKLIQGYQEIMRMQI